MLQGPAGGLLNVQQMNQIEAFENKTISVCYSQSRRQGQCMMIAVLSYPLSLSKRLAEILWWAGSEGSGTMYCVMKQADPVQAILLGEGIGGCRKCTLHVTKQRMLISTRVYSDTFMAVDIKCKSWEQMTWQKIKYFLNQRCSSVLFKGNAWWCIPQ